MKPILGVGWDVGGWLGSNQAVAAVTLEESDLKWCGSSACFSLRNSEENDASLLRFIRRTWCDAPDDVLEQYRVVIAIDAPLGFPTAFRELLASSVPGKRPSLDGHGKNSLAFRETDRHVHELLEARPLSASFDKLGNVATVAMWHARHWARESGIQIVPQQGKDDGDHTSIEVYPALVKVGETGECYPRFATLLSATPRAATGQQRHQYDAAICAVLALAYGMAGADARLPRLVGPPEMSDDDRATEGWIYYPEKGWLIGQEQATSRTQPS